MKKHDNISEDKGRQEESETSSITDEQIAEINKMLNEELDDCESLIEEGRDSIARTRRRSHGLTPEQWARVQAIRDRQTYDRERERMKKEAQRHRLESSAPSINYTALAEAIKARHEALTTWVAKNRTDDHLARSLIGREKDIVIIWTAEVWAAAQAGVVKVSAVKVAAKATELAKKPVTNEQVKNRRRIIEKLESVGPWAGLPKPY